MARIECYVSDELKEKIGRLADQQSISISKYISQILQNHCAGRDNHAIFQKKVMATLCDIYACVFDSGAENANRNAALARMQELKKQSEEAIGS